MTKIVYNGCYGGFSLSKDAIKRYAEIKGWGFREPDPENTWDSGRMVDLKGNEYSTYDLSEDRSDHILVQVVEELGEAANGNCAKLYIVEIAAGTRYRIDEYDGNENVMLIDDYDWKIA